MHDHKRTEQVIQIAFDLIRMFFKTRRIDQYQILFKIIPKQLSSEKLLDKKILRGKIGF